MDYECILEQSDGCEHNAHHAPYIKVGDGGYQWGVFSHIAKDVYEHQQDCDKQRHPARNVVRRDMKGYL